MIRELFRQLLRRKLGVLTLLVLGMLYFGAVFAPFLSPYDYETQSTKTFHPPTALVWHEGELMVQRYELTNKAERKYEPIEGDYGPLAFFSEGKLVSTVEKEDRLFLLGSDSTGRDVFSRLLYGGRVSLFIGIIGISITFVLGFIVGGLSGYFGGFFDFTAMRVVEFLMSIPTLYLLLSLRSALGDRFESDQMFMMIVIILAFIGWAGTARVIRGMSLSLRNRQFVLAAECLGQSTPNILRKHILPNVVSYLLVAATLSIPAYILGEAALSFLNLGIQEPAASWGLMLSQANQMKVFMLHFWWLLTPGLAIFLTVISFNVLGDVLRDIVDPKMKI